MAKVDWANKDEDIEAQLAYIEERYAARPITYADPAIHCPTCYRGWHGMPEGGCKGSYLAE
jgi:hypothetical protein